MNRKYVFTLAIAGALVIALTALQAGNLEPTAPPAPTMVTLQQIYDKLDGLTPGVVGVPKTGQTGCWDESGTSIPCAGTGQDGEYLAGASVNPRFTDNGDGTVTDNLTGLTWLQDADCLGSQTWTNALAAANGLASASDSCTPDLTDGSVAGDWRLPNLRELQSLIDYGNSFPALPTGHPFAGVQSSNYWSSTTHVDAPGDAWSVDLDNGGVDGDDVKYDTYYVWPVRAGQ